MIKFSNKTIKHLNDNYPIKEDVYIKIAEGFDVVEDPKTGERGFGAFDTEHKVIFVASLMGKEELIRTIAHEYKHAMQLFNNEEFDEDEAEKFADKVLKEIISRSGRCRMKKIISLILVIAIILLVGCADVVKTDTQEVEVIVIDEHHRNAWVQPCGRTWISHPAQYQITVLYDSVQYTINDSKTYYKFKDKIGDKAIGVLKISTYDDGSIKQDITKLKSSEVKGNE